jgi:hypothetical protein
MIEDEDMMNVALWRDGVSKAWCKFDVEPGLFTERARLDKNMYADPMWYPDGLPLLFISAHNTKGFEATDWLLNLLEHCSEKRFTLQCPENQDDKRICKVGSTAERATRRDPAAYASRACCCLEPRWEKPIFYYGTWYKNMGDVPLRPRGARADRLCLMP